LSKNNNSFLQSPIIEGSSEMNEEDDEIFKLKNPRARFKEETPNKSSGKILPHSTPSMLDLLNSSSDSSSDDERDENQDENQDENHGVCEDGLTPVSDWIVIDGDEPDPTSFTDFNMTLSPPVPTTPTKEEILQEMKSKKKKNKKKRSKQDHDEEDDEEDGDFVVLGKRRRKSMRLKNKKTKGGYLDDLMEEEKLERGGGDVMINIEEEEGVEDDFMAEENVIPLTPPSTSSQNSKRGKKKKKKREDENSEDEDDAFQVLMKSSGKRKSKRKRSKRKSGGNSEEDEDDFMDAPSFRQRFEADNHHDENDHPNAETSPFSASKSMLHFPKVLIFAHHKTMMDALEDGIKDMGIQMIRVDGSTGQKRRHELIKSFQTKPQISGVFEIKRFF